MGRAGIARASTFAVPNTVIMARRSCTWSPTFALYRVSLDARSCRGGRTRRFLRATDPEIRFRLPARRVASLRGISIIRRQPTRPASLRSQHRHAQSHNCPGVPDFEDFSLLVVLPKIDELKAIDERSHLAKPSHNFAWLYNVLHEC